MRDGHVTGVQTCALPISRKPFEAVPLRYQLSEAEIARVAVNEFLLEGVEVEAQLEIGRASCRERVGRSVVAAGLREDRGGGRADGGMSTCSAASAGAAAG